MTKDYWLVSLVDGRITHHRGRLEAQRLLVEKEALGESWTDEVSVYGCAVCASEEGARRTRDAVLQNLKVEADRYLAECEEALEIATRRVAYVARLMEEVGR